MGPSSLTNGDSNSIEFDPASNKKDDTNSIEFHGKGELCSHVPILEQTGHCVQFLYGRCGFSLKMNAGTPADLGLPQITSESKSGF